MLRRIPASSYRSMPWKNGGGRTTELALDPEGASLEEGSSKPFTWRVSIAELTESGPFSRFPGYDRILVQLEGPPMSLCHEGFADQALVALEPHVFAGELETSALVTGPARDFNVMVRRTHASAHVASHRLARGAEVIEHAEAGARLAYMLEGDATASFGDTSCHLATNETAIASGAGELALEAGATGATVLLVAIQSVGPFERD